MSSAMTRPELKAETEPVQEAQPHGTGEPCLSSPPTCPNCQSGHVHRHGYYDLDDGSRPQRFLCKACGKSFSLSTGTPLAYTKKRGQFKRFVETMGAGVPLRRHAAELGIHVSTAFRWRHRCLSPIACRPRPKLAGQVVMGEAYVGFSQKGQRARPQRPRRFLQRLPSRILLFACSTGHRMAMVGSPEHRMAGVTSPGHGMAVVSRPGRSVDTDRSGNSRKAVNQLGADLLQACVNETLAPDAELHVNGLPAFAGICRKAGLTVSDATPLERGEAHRIRMLTRSVHRMRASFHGWLVRFYGVATRYLHHYLAWYEALFRTDGQASWTCPSLL